MIELKDVVKMYDNGKRAINGVNLSVEAGQSVCVIGMAGSGKSVLSRLVAGMEEASAGSIVVDGKKVHEMDGDSAAVFRNQTIGVLVRKQSFMGGLTVVENIALPLSIHGTPTVQRLKAAQEQMDLFGLSHKASAYPSQLSILEQHLASIARALVSQPKVLLLNDFGAELSQKDFEKIYGILHAVWNFSEATTIRFTNKENDSLPMNRKLYLEHGKLMEVRE